MKRISKEKLDQIRALRVRRDQDCRALGVAVVEYAAGKQKAYAEEPEGSAALHLRLGVLLAELDRHQTAILGRIARDAQRQREVGEAALAEISLTDARRHFTINESTGAVLELVAGRYIEPKE